MSDTEKKNFRTCVQPGTGKPESSGESVGAAATIAKLKEAVRRFPEGEPGNLGQMCDGDYAMDLIAEVIEEIKTLAAAPAPSGDVSVAAATFTETDDVLAILARSVAESPEDSPRRRFAVDNLRNFLAADSPNSVRLEGELFTDDATMHDYLDGDRITSLLRRAGWEPQVMEYDAYGNRQDKDKRTFGPVAITITPLEGGGSDE